MLLRNWSHDLCIHFCPDNKYPNLYYIYRYRTELAPKSFRFWLTVYCNIKFIFSPSVESLDSADSCTRAIMINKWYACNFQQFVLLLSLQVFIFRLSNVYIKLQKFKNSTRFKVLSILSTAWLFELTHLLLTGINSRQMHTHQW